jgi:hypothetical protein
MVISRPEADGATVILRRRIELNGLKRDKKYVRSGLRARRIHAKKKGRPDLNGILWCAKRLAMMKRLFPRRADVQLPRTDPVVINLVS